MPERIRSVVWSLALCALAGASIPVAANDVATRGDWELFVSPYTHHYHASAHHEYVYALGLVRRLEKNRLAGAFAFSNSFGQPSVYLFAGQRYVGLPGCEKCYLQWTGGLLYGYVDEHKQKVPFNHNGFSPGLVLSVGHQFSRKVHGEVELIGTSALMFMLIFPLPANTFQ